MVEEQGGGGQGMGAGEQGVQRAEEARSGGNRVRVAGTGGTKCCRNKGIGEMGT
jgi:hypothetical protein